MPEICSRGHEIPDEYLERRKKDKKLHRCRKCRNEHAARHRRKGDERYNRVGKRRHGIKAKDETLYLDPAPFVAWFDRELERRIGWTEKDLCYYLKIHTRALRRYRHGWEKGSPVRISVDLVDEYLLLTDTHLWEVYPELYDFEGVAYP